MMLLCKYLDFTRLKYGIKIWQEYRLHHMETSKYFWSYLAHFFVEWELFNSKFVEKNKTFSVQELYFFLRKSYRLWDNVEKYCSAGQATDDHKAHAHFMMGTQGYRDTLRICNTCCFPLRQWVYGRASFLSHSYTARLIRFSIYVRLCFGGQRRLPFDGYRCSSTGVGGLIPFKCRG